MPSPPRDPDSEMVEVRFNLKWALVVFFGSISIAALVQAPHGLGEANATMLRVYAGVYALIALSSLLRIAYEFGKRKGDKP